MFEEKYNNNLSYSTKKRRGVLPGVAMMILYLCLISFILEYTVPGYFNEYAFVPALLFLKPWTLITHMFLHVNLTHLLFNMLVLFFFGPHLEKWIGKFNFLVVYFLSGIIAAIGYYLTVSDINIPVVGASGAILGVFAAIAVLEPNMKIYVYFIPMKIKYALVLFALFDFLMMGSNDTIAHTAHLSGMVVGLIMGFYFRNRLKSGGNYSDYRY